MHKYTTLSPFKSELQAGVRKHSQIWLLIPVVKDYLITQSLTVGVFTGVSDSVGYAGFLRGNYEH